MWECYKTSCEVAGIRYAQLTTFRKYWQQLVPHIIITKPRSDLCWMCQTQSTLIAKTKNSLQEKSQVLFSVLQTWNTVHVVYSWINLWHTFLFIISQLVKQAENHLKLVEKERAIYCKACEKSAHTFEIKAFPSCTSTTRCLSTTFILPRDIALQFWHGTTGMSTITEFL